MSGNQRERVENLVRAAFREGYERGWNDGKWGRSLADAAWNASEIRQMLACFPPDLRVREWPKGANR